MNEFELIASCFAPLAGPEGLGLLDDAALLTPDPGRQLVISTDSFVEGVHFPEGMYGADVAERLLRTNVSDLAAKAAEPKGYFLNLSMRCDRMRQWVPAFAKGLETTQQIFGCRLWGGDTTATRGPAVFSITLIGDLPAGAMIPRNGMAIGQDVWVTGTLGDAMLGCHLATEQPLSPPPSGAEIYAFEAAYWRPEPALQYREILRRYAKTAADISDGLLADAGHIAALGEGGISLDFDALPFSIGAEGWAESQIDPVAARQRLVSFGDDYGVVFTAAPSDRQSIFDLARQSNLRVSRVGRVGPGTGVVCLDVDGQAMDWPDRGFTHLGT